MYGAWTLGWGSSVAKGHDAKDEMKMASEGSFPE